MIHSTKSIHHSYGFHKTNSLFIQTLLVISYSNISISYSWKINNSTHIGYVGLYPRLRLRPY